MEPSDRTALMISVVIPHLNQPQMLARCLASLAAGRRPPDEIIVVDNGSAEPPEAICAAFPAVKLLSEVTPGPGPARNLGVAAAQGTILAFIDADCIADPGWLAAAEAALADSTAEILGGDVRIDLADTARLTMLEAYESIYAYRMDLYITRQGYTGTGNLIVRRPVFDSVGPFGGLDVAEDRDWGQRATASGHALRYIAAMRVYHPARANFAGLYAKWDRHSAHEYQAACVRPGGRLRFAIKAMAMALSPLAELPKIASSDRVSGLRSRVLAFVALARIRAYRSRLMVWLVTGGDAAVLAGRWNREKPTE